jgi:hypothetical protein
MSAPIEKIALAPSSIACASADQVSCELAARGLLRIRQ